MDILRWGTIIIAIFWLLACTGPQVNHKPGGKNSSTLAVTKTLTHTPAKVVATARSVLGTRYRYGGDNTDGFDCSGLVSYAYRSIGITVPRSSSEQFRQSIPVPLHILQPVDLLFFRLNPPKISHVAIYDHEGRFIHAPSSGKQVGYASLSNPYWRDHLVAAGRF